MYRGAVATQITKWAMELVNHTSITDRQKANGLTAYQEQFANQDTLYTAYGINIAAWGTLCYCLGKWMLSWSNTSGHNEGMGAAGILSQADIKRNHHRQGGDQANKAIQIKSVGPI